MKTVLAHGVFDLLHSGHVSHLMQCKSFGDFLIVSVVADKFVRKKRKLVCNELERTYMVGALKCVDQVVLCEAEGPDHLLARFRPYIYVRNDEYVLQNKPEYSIAKSLGIRVAFTRTQDPHTTDLLARIRRG